MALMRSSDSLEPKKDEENSPIDWSGIRLLEAVDNLLAQGFVLMHSRPGMQQKIAEAKWGQLWLDLSQLLGEEEIKTLLPMAYDQASRSLGKLRR